MPDAIRTNRMRCRVAVVSCSLLSFLVFLAVCDQLLSTPDAIVQEVGWKSYHMFTILANMFAGIAAALCIPYAVDGLRYDNYHLPRWVVNVLYMATTGVALTFLIAVTVLSPMTSYYRMMLYSNNILFHTINPIIAILLFIFINSDHKVSFRSTFLAIAPVVLYAALYFVLVFVIGEENGGWRDHYQIRDITQYVPLPLVVLGMVLIAFAVALLLRAAHNSVHKKRKKQTVSYYQSAGEFDCPSIDSAIEALAARNRSRDPGGELTVPRRILGMMEEKYKSGLPLRELCRMYIDAYYEKGEKEQ
ncbi:MAG: hypothetical protein IJL59_05335 [Clostridia bacterium]|nr:hypothetical protein [Clostridia bacterium]MBQ6234735.1 hypothetical protein [Clostridia bacterium]